MSHQKTLADNALDNLTTLGSITETDIAIEKFANDQNLSVDEKTEFIKLCKSYENLLSLTTEDLVKKALSRFFASKNNKATPDSIKISVDTFIDKVKAKNNNENFLKCSALQLINTTDAIDDEDYVIRDILSGGMKKEANAVMPLSRQLIPTILRRGARPVAQRLARSTRGLLPGAKYVQNANIPAAEARNLLAQLNFGGQNIPPRVPPASHAPGGFQWFGGGFRDGRFSPHVSPISTSGWQGGVVSPPRATSGGSGGVVSTPHATSGGSGGVVSPPTVTPGGSGGGSSGSGSPSGPPASPTPGGPGGGHNNPFINRNFLLGVGTGATVAPLASYAWDSASKYQQNVKNKILQELIGNMSAGELAQSPSMMDVLFNNMPNNPQLVDALRHQLGNIGLGQYLSR